LKFSLYYRIIPIKNDNLHVYIEYKENRWQTVNCKLGPVPIVLVDEIMYELKQTLEDNIRNIANNLFETFR